MDVVLSRRAAAFLLVTGAFQWVIWPTFLHNIWKDPRSFSHGDPTAFLLVHAVLTVASLALATGLLLVGGRSWRAAAR
ncbi:MAG: hypothetical protein JWM02_1964 [Frankiales bacterium]|nr:hypothetical protein [Frankiales bacterium]